MRSLSRSLPILIGVVAGAALLVAACGGDDSGGSTSTATAAPPVATVASGGASPSATTTTTTTTAAKLVGTADTAKGKVLTDSKGMTLYTFKPDASTAGKSNCNGSCATTWPPLTSTDASAPANPEGATGSFALIMRDDGAKQVSYNNAPLYRYAGDNKAGDTTGDGIGNVWFVALATTTTAAASPTAASQAQGGASPASGSASTAASGTSPTNAPPAPTATTVPAQPQPTTVPPTPTKAPPAPTPTTDPYAGGGYNY